MNKFLIAGVMATGLSLTAACGFAWAQERGPHTQPLALQKIMKDLGVHMQTITDGISREDWTLVAKTAPLIADHPRPPVAERTRILTFIGADAGKFRTHDGRTHDAAATLTEVAAREDGPAVIAAFGQLQLSCYNCHQAFRQSIVNHFYSGQ